MIRSHGQTAMNDTENFPWERLEADANGDGSVTIGDLGAWFVDLALLPGDLALHYLATYAPGVAAFLELDRGDYGGAFAIWASAMIWLLALLAAGVLLNALRNLDRNLTAYLAGRYAEACRVLRVLRRRCAAWATDFMRRRERGDAGLRIEPVILEQIERGVLRCLTNIDDGAVLTLEEVAARLKSSAREVKAAVGRLIELQLIEPGRDGFDKREGHRITPAGQMYLLGN